MNKPLWRLLAASGATHWRCMPNIDDDDAAWILSPRTVAPMVKFLYTYMILHPALMAYGSMPLFFYKWLLFQCSYLTDIKFGSNDWNDM